MLNLVNVRTPILAVILFVFSTSFTFAKNIVVVIPVSGEDLQPLANIVTVAKENGDFTDPAAAIESIDDASENKPYLVIVAPGVYVLNTQIVMKPFVSLSGSGIDTTIIKGSFSGSSLISSNAALLSMANNTSLSHMTLENNVESLSGFAYAVRALGVSKKVHLRDFKALSTGAKWCKALYIVNATVDISRVEANANGCDYNYGGDIRSDGNVTIDYSRFVASGGEYNYGFSLSTNSDGELRHSYFKGLDGDDFGLAISGGATARVSHSTVDGGIASLGAGIYTCLFTDDGNGNELRSDCLSF
jgi:hypothetical protein